MKKWENTAILIAEYVIIVLCGWVIGKGLLMIANNDPHGLVTMMIGIILLILTLIIIITKNRFKN
jgi:hypothetical protein